jgi:uncharacterized protein
MTTDCSPERWHDPDMTAISPLLSRVNIEWVQMNRKRPSFFCFLFLFCILAGDVFGGEACEFGKTATVELVRGQEAVAAFSVSLADSPESRRKGLMHCPVLAPETGMLFVYPNAGKRVFWMKDTSIELAIIFISADDRIASIAHGEPGSLEHIQSPENIHFVLEVNYPEGQGLAVGDRVRLRLNADIDAQPSSYRP